MSKPTPIAPTQSELDRNGVWQIAFTLSEMVNDNAPLGWEKYIPLAEKSIEEAKDL